MAWTVVSGIPTNHQKLTSCTQCINHGVLHALPYITMAGCRYCCWCWIKVEYDITLVLMDDKTHNAIFTSAPENRMPADRIILLAGRSVMNGWLYHWRVYHNLIGAHIVVWQRPKWTVTLLLVALLAGLPCVSRRYAAGRDLRWYARTGHTNSAYIFVKDPPGVGASLMRRTKYCGLYTGIYIIPGHTCFILTVMPADWPFLAGISICVHPTTWLHVFGKYAIGSNPLCEAHTVSSLACLFKQCSSSLPHKVKTQ